MTLLASAAIIEQKVKTAHGVIASAFDLMSDGRHESARETCVGATTTF
jgi:hypothetical protein